MTRRAAVPAPERLFATRIVARAGAIDAAGWPEGVLVLRLAEDEALMIPAFSPAPVVDPDAIVEVETGFSALWLNGAEAVHFLERECDWELPAERPVVAQGMVAGLPVKLWFERDRVLVLVPSPYAVDLAERLR
jgi:hypothetical protein